MALGDPYATVAELEARLGRTDDGTFTGLLDAASRRVESFTRRQFNQTTVASARRFRPVDPQRLPVDDFHTTTDLAVETNDTVWDPDQIDPRPWDGIVNGQEGWPFFDLFAVGRCWPWNRRAKVTVTAQWGWAEVPAAIPQATLDVAVVMSHGSDGANAGPVASEAIDGYSVRYQARELANIPDAQAPPELRKAVPYRRKRFGVA